MILIRVMQITFSLHILFSVIVIAVKILLIVLELNGLTYKF